MCLGEKISLKAAKNESVLQKMVDPPRPRKKGIGTTDQDITFQKKVF